MIDNKWKQIRCRLVNRICGVLRNVQRMNDTHQHKHTRSGKEMTRREEMDDDDYDDDDERSIVVQKWRDSKKVRINEKAKACVFACVREREKKCHGIIWCICFKCNKVSYLSFLDSNLYYIFCEREPDRGSDSDSTPVWYPYVSSHF